MWRQLSLSIRQALSPWVGNFTASLGEGLQLLHRKVDRLARTPQQCDTLDVCIAGATGLVGGELLAILLAEPRVATVWCLGRTPPSVQNPKLRYVHTDFASLQAAGAITAEVFFCTLGTTLRAAGSKEKFREVDGNYVLEFGRLAQRSGAQRLLVVSALGADSKSRFFYNRVKGDTDARLQALQIPNIIVLRPSLLLGQRNKPRLFESLFIHLTPAYSWLLRGALKKYQPIPAAVLAQAMWRYATVNDPGAAYTVVENAVLLEQAG